MSGQEVSSLAHELCHVCGIVDEAETDACALRAAMVSDQAPDLSRWEGSIPGPDGAHVSGRWTRTGSMNEPRSQHALTLLADGRVLAAGGCNHYSDEYMGCQALRSAELYDPSTGTWTPTAPMSRARRNYGAVLLRDGRVLVAGGCEGFQMCCLRSAELYDPAEETWTPAASMAMRRGSREDAHALVLLEDGRALFTGGLSEFCGIPELAFAEIYDPSTDRWEPTGPTAWPRGYTSAVALPSGEVLAVGGFAGRDSWRAVGSPAAEVYHPESNSWTEASSLGRKVLGNTLTLTGAGDVLLTNGFSDTCAYLGGGSGLLGGGPCPSVMRAYRPGAEQAEADLYQPSTGRWEPAPPMRFPRLIQSATRLRSGRVLVVAGNWIGCEQDDAGASLGCSPYMAPQGEIYDPWLRTWTLTPPMPSYVLGTGAAVLLASGDVLYAGGVVSSPFFLYEVSIRSAQLFREDAPPQADPGAAGQPERR